MAKTYNVGRLSVEMVADTVQYVQKMKSAETTTKKTQGGISDSINKTGKQARASAKDVNKLDKKLKKLGDAATFVNGPMGGVASRITSLNSLIGGGGGAIAVTAGLALGIAAAGTAALIASVQYAKQYKELKIYADVAGVTTRELRLLSGATNTVGISTEKFGDITKDVQDKIGDFVATGGGEFANVMDVLGDKLGYTATQLQNMSGPDALEAVAHAMQRANVPMGQQIFLMESIANDSSRLLPLYANLSEEMNNQKDITEKLTRTMDEDLLSVYTDLDRATVRLKDNMLDATADGLSPFAEKITVLTNAMNFWLASLEEGSKAADRYRLAEIRNEMDDTRKSITNLSTASGRFSNIIAFESTDIKVLRGQLMKLSDEYDKLNTKINTKPENKKPPPKTEVDPQSWYGSEQFKKAVADAEKIQRAQEADAKRIAAATKKREDEARKIEKVARDKAIDDDAQFYNEVTQLKKRHEEEQKRLDEEKKKREKKDKKDKKESHEEALAEDEEFYDEITQARENYQQKLTDAYELNSMVLAVPTGDPTTDMDNNLELLKINGERELELLRQQYAHKKGLENEYQAAMQASKTQYYSEVLTAHQNSINAEIALYKNVAGAIGNQIAALAGATDEEKDALTKQFIMKQGLAAADATLSYYSTLAAHEATAATMGVAGGGYLASQTALATTNYQRNLAGIAAITVGGVAAGQFHSGTDNVPSEGSYLLQQGERVIQPKANKDLTEFMANGGGSGEVTISAPISIQGNVTDEKWFNEQLVKQRNTISLAVQKVNRERPSARRRNS